MLPVVLPTMVAFSSKVFSRFIRFKYNKVYGVLLANVCCCTSLIIARAVVVLVVICTADEFDVALLVSARIMVELFYVVTKTPVTLRNFAVPAPAETAASATNPAARTALFAYS